MDKSKLYLAFINLMGINSDGKYIYRFDFTEDPDSVWGNGWNFTPSGSMSKIDPEENVIIASGRVMSEEEYLLATKNTCFSMQDCIDGIIPLMFSELPSDNILILRFGETFENVEKILSDNKLFISDLKERMKSEDDIIGNAMDKLGDINKKEDNNNDSDYDF